jgi:glycerol-3-phosphate dehydrogenase (NAD(P)+)
VNVTVIGSGSWGTAFARLLSVNGHAVQVVTLTAQEAAELAGTRVNPRFLPGVVLPESVRFVAVADADLDDSEMIAYVVPTQAIREVAAWVATRRSPASLQLSLAKGLELGTLLRPSEVIAAVTGSPAAVLSGPNHAEEVSRDMPSATVIAADDADAARRLQAAITCETFRVYTSRDVLGVEFCGAAKNPIAIAVGIADGLGFGDNTRASLMTRSLAEVTRVGIRLGASVETFAGLAGIGDLVATCTSRHSRNRLAGELLGRGTPAAQVPALVGQVVEGIPTTYALRDLGRRFGVDMPVIDNVFEVLENHRSASDCVGSLMKREAKTEFGG